MSPRGPGGAIELRLLGPLALARGDEEVALPRSRKVRALLAYLAMAPRPVTRSHLCELLWDVPADPRGELRWCLSKLRAALAFEGAPRVVADGDEVALDAGGCGIDVREVDAALRAGLATLPAGGPAVLADRLARGELLEGLELPRSPAFTGWLMAERRRLHAVHAAVLEQVVAALAAGSGQRLAAAARWLALSPFDRRAHEQLLSDLAAAGRLREGEEHLAATIRQYEAEGQDWRGIARAWAQAKAAGAHSEAARAPGVSAGAPAPDAPVPAPGSPGPAPRASAQGSAAPAAPAAAHASPPVAGADAPAIPHEPARRASIAVMPFVDADSAVPPRGGLADGLARDIITRLAKLRSVFVIADGTMFALAERRLDAGDAGRRLEVDYVASGRVRRTGHGLQVSVQLAEARGARVIWAEDFAGRSDDTFAVLDGIGDRIVASIASEVEASERNRAILKNPHSLTAWEAHHRGLWHMVRFTPEDNQQARQFFQTAARLDPTFARPHAGVSFTHFQDAFLGWGERGRAIESAYAAASQGLLADDRDPMAHWSLGRALWLKGRPGEAREALGTAVDLSPNFALGHYALAWLDAQVGDPSGAMDRADLARTLSPWDPMLAAMLATRALALMRLGRHAEASEWALRAAARPNAHAHILAVAMYSLALDGRGEEARAMAARVRSLAPGYSADDFTRAFKLAEGGAMLQQAQRVLAA